MSGQELLDGTWKLIKSTRTNSATGATVDTFGANPKGFITYGKDGRMMAIIVRGDRLIYTTKPAPSPVDGSVRGSSV